MKTAVDWLFDEIKHIIPNDFLNKIAEAKEMEKQQHGKTWDSSMRSYELRGGNFIRAWGDFDDYYNENFKK